MTFDIIIEIKVGKIIEKCQSAVGKKDSLCKAPVDSGQSTRLVLSIHCIHRHLPASARGGRQRVA